MVEASRLNNIIKALLEGSVLIFMLMHPAQGQLEINLRIDLGTNQKAPKKVLNPLRGFASAYSDLHHAS